MAEYEPHEVRVCDQDGEFLFWCSEQTARSILSHQAADFIRNAEGPVLWAAPQKWRRLYSGPDHGLGWLLGSHWPSPFSIIAAEQRRELMDKSIDSLPAAERKLVQLRYEQDLTFEEIGAAFGFSKEAAWQMHQKALCAIRTYLAGAGVRKLAHV